MAKPIVAIVGRPNVGKSSIFNRLIGKRQSIVLDTPGITRDLVYGDVHWGGRIFTVVDTGGFVPDAQDTLTKSVLERLKHAVDESDLVMFLGDAIDGPTAVEHEIVAMLRKTGKPTIMVVNKVDNPRREDMVYPFHEFGFEKVMGISAIQGLQVGDMLDEVIALLPPPTKEMPDKYKGAIPLAIIGRPNVGKSTLLNSLLGKTRAIVDSTPGTTRDPVDILKERDGKKYLFVDTAGIRRRGKIERGAEWVSVLRAEQALERCEVALLVLDAAEGPVEGDAHVFGLAQKAAKACIILANKWDLIEKDNSTSGEMAKKIRDTVKFLPFAPIMSISALSGQRVSKIYQMIDAVYKSYHRQVPPEELSALLEQILERHPPVAHKGKRQVHFYKIAQARAAPPTFLIETNMADALHFSYERYLVNQINERFDFSGSPVLVRFKQRGPKEKSRKK